MIKYFHFARIALEDHLRNRLRLFTRFVVFMMWSWVMAHMWDLITATRHLTLSVSSIDMNWYMGLAQFAVFISPRLFVVIDDDVRSGNIGYFLNRPMPYLWMRFAEGFGALFGNLMIYCVLGLPYLYFLYQGMPSEGVWVLIPVIILIIIGSILHLLFQVCCGLFTLWSDDAIVVYYCYQKMILLLGGVYVPIMLFPAFFFPEILKLLPFASLAGNGASLVFQYTHAAFIEYICLQVFWVAVMIMAMSSLYNICLRKVEVNGG